MSLRVTVRKSELHDCCSLKDRLREEHVAEVWSFSRHTPEQSLVLSYISSVESYTVLLNDVVPIFMFGVVDDKQGNGIAWALGSDNVDQVWLQFAKQTREKAQGLLKHFPVIYNYIDARYKTGLRWVEWIGGTLYPPEPLAFDSELFQRWELKRSE